MKMKKDEFEFLLVFNFNKIGYSFDKISIIKGIFNEKQTI